jgi:hypothetical protein
LTEITSTPFDVFSANIDRAKKATSSSDDEMVRFGIVIAVAAMDDYFTSKFCSLIIPFIMEKELTEPLQKRFEDAGFTIKDAFEIIQHMQENKDGQTRPWSIIRNKIASSLSRKTVQNMDVLDSFFKTFGKANLSKKAFEKMRTKRGCLSGSSLRAKAYEKYMQELIERRHQIVHECDYNEKKVVFVQLAAQNLRKGF